MDSDVPRRTLRADTLDLLKMIQEALQDKKAANLTILDVGSVSSLAEVFLLASGTSRRHLQTLLDEVRERTAEEGLRPYGIEGQGTGWCLVDFGDIVVHLFDEETREFYDLERLWLDAPELDEEALVAGATG